VTRLKSVFSFKARIGELECCEDDFLGDRPFRAVYVGFNAMLWLEDVSRNGERGRPR